jgi:hypothetical protein
MSKVIIALAVGFGVAFVVGFGLHAVYAAVGAKGGVESYALPIGLGALSAYLAGNLAGNRRVAAASAAEKTQALAFTPPEGQGQLIIFRDGFVGKAVGLNLALDERPFAQIKSPRFTSIYVPAGSHSLVAGFGGLAGPQNKTAHAQVDFHGGEVLAVKARVAMGALQNSLKLDAVPMSDQLKAQLARMTMVKPE